VGAPILARPGIHIRKYLRECFDQESEPCPVFPGGTVCWPVSDPASRRCRDLLLPYRAARDRVRKLVREHFGV
jgi:hypothetical protein